MKRWYLAAVLAAVVDRGADLSAGGATAQDGGGDYTWAGDTNAPDFPAGLTGSTYPRRSAWKTCAQDRAARFLDVWVYQLHSCHP